MPAAERRAAEFERGVPAPAPSRLRATGGAAAIWTKDLDKAHRCAREVKAGPVWVNCYHVVDTTTLFGGSRCPRGHENGEASLEHYTELKKVTIKLG